MASGGTTGAGGAPTRTNDCMPSPHLCGFPDQTNTGVPSGTTLSAPTSCVLTTAGAVLDAKDFACNVEIRAANVKITRSKIHPGGSFGVNVVSGSVVVEDSEFFGTSNAALSGQHDAGNWTCRRCNIHDFADDGAKLFSNTTLVDSYIHDFKSNAGDHADGAQMQDGATAVLVRHNTIDGRADSGATSANSALFIAPDQGPTSNGPLTIDGNLMAGGNYTVQIVDGNNGQYFIKNVTLTNNRFVHGSSQYGALRLQDDEVPYTTLSNNVWDQDGTPIP